MRVLRAITLALALIGGGAALSAPAGAAALPIAGVASVEAAASRGPLVETVRYHGWRGRHHG